MTKLSRFNKAFYENTVLKAQDLRDIVAEINDIIDHINALHSGGSQAGDPTPVNPDTDPTPSGGDDSGNNGQNSEPDQGGTSAQYSATLTQETINQGQTVRYTVSFDNDTYNALQGKTVTFLVQYSNSVVGSGTWLNGGVYTFLIDTHSFQKDLDKPSTSRKYRFKITVVGEDIVMYTNEVIVMGTGLTPGGDTGNTGEQDNSGTVPDHSDPDTGVPEPADPYDPTQPEQQVQ